MPEFEFVVVKSKPRTFGSRIFLPNERFVYDMAGFDSATGNRVYWISYDKPFLTPSRNLTSPPVLGTLEFPHIVGKHTVLL
ncbi:MAG: hypothetical protein PHH59_16375 [Methylovulum sp.]|uniref:hypothetical protein n=1 Tax=Methylovulum sp. TaxID=1916980 RepID=UPI0026230947|nr:hypothetical protein [Methylovulum sp.]MDD2725579.1 hypothetical protein [Methylovulum sp.]MDD5126036.1 hypothetical protein [Methylovulum sp.]